MPEVGVDAEQAGNRLKSALRALDSGGFDRTVSRDLLDPSQYYVFLDGPTEQGTYIANNFVVFVKDLVSLSDDDLVFLLNGRQQETIEAMRDLAKESNETIIPVEEWKDRMKDEEYRHAWTKKSVGIKADGSFYAVDTPGQSSLRRLSLGSHL